MKDILDFPNPMPCQMETSDGNSIKLALPYGTSVGVRVKLVGIVHIVRANIIYQVRMLRCLKANRAVYVPLKLS